MLKGLQQEETIQQKIEEDVTPYAGTTEGIESLSVHWKYMRIPAYLEKEGI